MSDEVIIGFLELFGIVLTVWVANSKTIYRIEQLEKKQDKHNSLIERMFLLEKRLDVDEHRIKDIEDEMK